MTKINKDVYPDVQPGVTVKIHQKIKEISAKGEEKERIQIFEGIVIARKHGSNQNATITVRKISNGIGVEKIFPLHLPAIEKIEPIKKAKVARGKLYFVRHQKHKFKEEKVK